ncbi:MAG: PHP domain-containing protein [Candidatus Omnitrophota bacterium]|nr:MAG: PHP domain-containing protein [Candidatus Omnitrophota bacterium]
MQNKRCDLHIHSKFSDSDADIEDIFKAAVSKGVSCIAITDHDTVDGMEKAILYSKSYNIELIEAIELSVAMADTEVHILGYLIDSKNKKLKEAVAQIKKLRRERLASMIERLNKIGVKLDREEVFSKIKNNTPTRLHLALAMVEKGVVTSLVEAFRRYLAPGRPGYVGRFKYSVKEAIDLIKECAGLSFLAHPQALKSESWIGEFVSWGLDGLEVVYPRFSEAKTLYYKNIADKYGLLKSGGSDAHGTFKKFTNVGDVTVPYSWVQEMKQRKIKISNSNTQ